jgi:hypothetical protein
LGIVRQKDMQSPNVSAFMPARRSCTVAASPYGPAPMTTVAWSAPLVEPVGLA